MELVASHWKIMPRLLRMVFSPTMNYASTVRVVWRRSSLTDGSLLPSRSYRGSRSMSHLRNLDTLAIPSILWLNGDLLLPMTLDHLEIAFADQDVLPKLHNYLTSRPLLCNHLRSIIVGRQGPIVRPVTPSIQAKESIARRLNLPLLFNLELQEHGVPGFQLSLFLRSLFCPSLETVALRIPRERPESPAEVSTTRIPALDSSNAVDDSFQWPNLRELVILFDCSLQSINCLRMFPTRTVKRLTIEVKFKGLGPATSPSDWNDASPEFAEQFIAAISKFHPEDLSLINILYRDAWSSITSMATQFLEKLRIQVEGGMTGCGQIAFDDSQVLLPQLKKLTLSGSEGYLRHFLAHIQAAQLHSLTMEVEPPDLARLRSRINDSNMADSLMTLTSMDPFASVQTLEMQLSPSGWRSIRFPWMLFPNVQELHAVISHPGVSDTGIVYFDGYIETFCDSLRPTNNQGSVPFPHLRSLSASCKQAIMIEGDSRGQQVRGLDTARESIDKFLTERTELGALPLLVTEPVRITSIRESQQLGQTYIRFDAHLRTP